jgi:acetyltransferase
LAFELILRDGHRVLVRPVVPEDAQLLQEGMTQMSLRSRLFRFHRRISRLSRKQLRELAAVDQRTHVAWGALSLGEPNSRGIGVARYILEPDDPATARAIITVIDDYQGLGLGTALLEMLRLTAHENGVTRLVGHLLPENVAARRLFGRAGGVETGRTCEARHTIDQLQPSGRPLPCQSAASPGNIQRASESRNACTSSTECRM